MLASNPWLKRLLSGPGRLYDAVLQILSDQGVRRTPVPGQRWETNLLLPGEFTIKSRKERLGEVILDNDVSEASCDICSL